MHPDGYIGAVWEQIEYPQILERIDAGYVTDIEEIIIDGKQ